MQTTIVPRLVFVLLGLLVSIGLPGCGSGPSTLELTIPFDTLGRGAIVRGAPIPELEEGPAIFVAGSRDETASFTKWLHTDMFSQLVPSAEIVSRVQGVDFDKAWVVAVLPGRIGGINAYIPAYPDVTVRTITAGLGTVRLTVELREPEAGNSNRYYGFHVVLIPKEQLSLQSGTIWTMQKVDGTVLAQTIYPSSELTISFDSLVHAATTSLLVFIDGELDHLEEGKLVLRQKVSPEVFRSIDLTTVRGLALFSCTRQGSETQCGGADVSEIQPGARVCAHAIVLDDGRLVAGKIFVNAMCGWVAVP